MRKLHKRLHRRPQASLHRFAVARNLLPGERSRVTALEARQEMPFSGVPFLPQSRRRIVSSISSPRPGAKSRLTPTRRNPAFSSTRSEPTRGLCPVASASDATAAQKSSVPGQLAGRAVRYRIRPSSISVVPSWRSAGAGGLGTPTRPRALTCASVSEDTPKKGRNLATVRAWNVCAQRSPASLANQSRPLLLRRSITPSTSREP